MSNKLRSIRKDERGVEPTVMKILVGVILVGIGLGVGIPLYLHFGSAAKEYLNYSIPDPQPPEGTISKDNSGTAEVSVESFAGYSKPVTLTASGVPSNVTVLFNEQSSYSNTPPYEVTMKISVGAGASSGTYTITIRGTSEDGTKTASYELTVP